MKILLTDIDGVVLDWVAHFEKYLNTYYPDNKLAKQYLAQVYHQIPGKKQLAIDIETEISGKIDFNE